MVKVYLSGYGHQVREFKEHGFEDPEPSPYVQEKTSPGIVLSDAEPDLDYLEESMELELPEDLLLPYEATEPGFIPRTFCVPAQVLNDYLEKLGQHCRESRDQHPTPRLST